jgi:hypothetical protein
MNMVLEHLNLVPDDTVARRPKILQINSKPAEKRNCLDGKTGGRTTAVFGQNRLKTGRKNNLWKTWFFE